MIREQIVEIIVVLIVIVTVIGIMHRIVVVEITVLKVKYLHFVDYLKLHHSIDILVVTLFETVFFIPFLI